MLSELIAVLRYGFPHLIKFREFLDLSLLERLHQVVDSLPNFCLDLKPLEFREPLLWFVLVFVLILRLCTHLFI